MNQKMGLGRPAKGEGPGTWISWGCGEGRRGTEKAKEREGEIDLLCKFLFFGWPKKKKKSRQHLGE